jgi:hypothetical protein
METKMKFPTISVSVEHEQVPVAMMSPAQVPDEQWRYVDKKGHGHFWKKDKLPTLEWVVTGTEWVGDEYDGDEYEVGEYRCKICAEVIKPGKKSDYGPSFVPGPTTITLDINGEQFLLTPELYAESVYRWVEILRSTY